jgi:hypothetical protein
MPVQNDDSVAGGGFYFAATVDGRPLAARSF